MQLKTTAAVEWKVTQGEEREIPLSERGFASFLVSLNTQPSSFFPLLGGCEPALNFFTAMLWYYSINNAERSIKYIKKYVADKDLDEKLHRSIKKLTSSPSLLSTENTP